MSGLFARLATRATGDGDRTPVASPRTPGRFEPTVERVADVPGEVTGDAATGPGSIADGVPPLRSARAHGAHERDVDEVGVERVRGDRDAGHVDGRPDPRAAEPPADRTRQHVATRSDERLAPTAGAATEDDRVRPVTWAEPGHRTTPRNGSEGHPTDVAATARGRDGDGGDARVAAIGDGARVVTGVLASEGVTVRSSPTTSDGARVVASPARQAAARPPTTARDRDGAGDGEAPVVTIHIGRVEVRSAPPRPSPRPPDPGLPHVPPGTRRSAALGLQEYLQGDRGPR